MCTHVTVVMVNGGLYNVYVDPDIAKREVAKLKELKAGEVTSKSTNVVTTRDTQ